MRKLIVFNQVTLDGFFSGPNGDISWAHQNQDEEWNSFIASNAKSGGVLLFGRITYELMLQHWPTPEAKKNDPVVAEQMNELPKVVFSKTLEKVSWNNTKLVKEKMSEEVQKMKNESGPDLVVMGSGSIVAQLTQHGLIDEYQIIINPIVIGSGRTLFEGVRDRSRMKLQSTRNFANGNVLLNYRNPASKR